MAVETLSPDWEFDRVDDGSQSKRATRRGLRADAPALTSVLAAFLRKGSASRSLRSRRVPGTFCGLRGMRSRAFLSGLGISRCGSGWPGQGSSFGAGTLPRSQGYPWGSGVRFLQPWGTGGAGPGRPSRPERSLALSLDSWGFRQIIRAFNSG